MIIRQGRIEERLALIALLRRASLMNAADRDWLLAHPEVIDLPLAHLQAGRVLVAEQPTRRLGLAVVLPRQEGDAELDGLFVEPDLWRTGVGRALLTAAEAKARAGGAAIMRVVANPEALGFYVACGYEVVGEVPTRFRPALAMRKLI